MTSMGWWAIFWGRGKRRKTQKHSVLLHASIIQMCDSHYFVKCVEFITCKEEAAIRVMLSVETERMILLPENCRLIWPRTAECPLHTGWRTEKSIILFMSVLTVLCLCPCAPYTFSFHCGPGWCFLTQSVDCLSASNKHRLEICAQTDANTHTLNTDPFVNMWTSMFYLNVTGMWGSVKKETKLRYISKIKNTFT